MIVVCGSLEPSARRESLAMVIAERATKTGAWVQVIGIVPDGVDGDRRLVDLAAAGIGHAAVLRTAVRSLEAADVELALRYLPDIGVVVATDATPALIPALLDGAGYAGAALLLIVDAEATLDPASLPSTAIVLQAPAHDPDATFAGFVGAFAARLDGGAVPADAWAATVRELAVDPVTPGPGRRDRAS